MNQFMLNSSYFTDKIYSTHINTCILLPAETLRYCCAAVILTGASCFSPSYCVSLVLYQVSLLYIYTGLPAVLFVGAG